MSAVALENQERRIGRHRELVSRAEDLSTRLRRQGLADAANTISVLCDIVVRQEIELRQAIRDKSARGVVVHL